MMLGTEPKPRKFKMSSEFVSQIDEVFFIGNTTGRSDFVIVAV